MHVNANKGCSMGYHLDQIGMEKVSDQQKKEKWHWTYHKDG